MGTFIGALILTLLDNVLGLNSVSANWQLIVKGLIVIIAVVIQRPDLFSDLAAWTGRTFRRTPDSPPPPPTSPTPTGSRSEQSTVVPAAPIRQKADRNGTITTKES